MRTRYLPEAVAEIAEARSWYKARDRAVAARFRAELDEIRGRIRRFPLSGHPLPGGDERHVPFPGFPFSLVYLIENDEIVVTALAHHSRSRGYWRGR
jgi:hypothetical protein